MVFFKIIYSNKIEKDLFSISSIYLKVINNIYYQIYGEEETTIMKF